MTPPSRAELLDWLLHMQRLQETSPGANDPIIKGFADKLKVWQEMVRDDGVAQASPPEVKPLPGELAFIQVLWKALNHIASYSPVSRIQPVLIARDAIKEANALTFESEPIKAALSAVSSTNQPMDGAHEVLRQVKKASDAKLHGTSVSSKPRGD